MDRTQAVHFARQTSIPDQLNVKQLRTGRFRYRTLLKERDAGTSNISLRSRIYGARFPQYRKWKSGLKASDPAQEYRLYRFVPAQLKVFDESAFGEAVFVRAAVGAGDS
jgi:hypothetical protein